MEAGFWISVVVLLVGIFASWFIQAYWSKKSEERTTKVIERTISPLAEVAASTKMEVKNIEKKIGRKRKNM